MIKFIVVIDDCHIPVYIDNLTSCMQMRFGKDKTHHFEGGIDLISEYWLTCRGIYGVSLDMMVYYYLKYTKKRPDYIYITDDTEVDKPRVSVPITNALGNDITYIIIEK